MIAIHPPSFFMDVKPLIDKPELQAIKLYIIICTHIASQVKVSSFHFCPNRRALPWVSRRRSTSRLANWSLTITSEIKKASSTWHWWPISFWSVWKWADILEQSSRPSLTLQVRTKSVTTEVNCEFPAGETSAFSCVHIRGEVGGPWTEDAKSFSLFGPAYVSHFQEAPKKSGLIGRGSKHDVRPSGRMKLLRSASFYSLHNKRLRRLSTCSFVNDLSLSFCIFFFFFFLFRLVV